VIGDANMVLHGQRPLELPLDVGALEAGLGISPGLARNSSEAHDSMPRSNGWSWSSEATCLPSAVETGSMTETPTVRTRSRIIVSCCSEIWPAFVNAKSANGICRGVSSSTCGGI
jgi:hypothetical protein